MAIQGRVVRTGVLIAVSAQLLSWSSIAHAFRCKSPSPQQIEQVRDYVGELHKLSSKDFLFALSMKTGRGCYWKLQFETPSPEGSLTVYLSPNRRFISSDTHDLRTDPVVEEKEQNRELTTALTSGSPPSLCTSAAKITIVEFADFECPYCAPMSQIMDTMLGDHSSIRVVFRNFPLQSHPWASAAAEMGECAADQGELEFWKIHDFFFLNQSEINVSNIHDNRIYCQQYSFGCC